MCAPAHHPRSPSAGRLEHPDRHQLEEDRLRSVAERAPGSAASEESLRRGARGRGVHFSRGAFQPGRPQAARIRHGFPALGAARLQVAGPQAARVRFARDRAPRHAQFRPHLGRVRGPRPEGTGRAAGPSHHAAPRYAAPGFGRRRAHRRPQKAGRSR